MAEMFGDGLPYKSTAGIPQLYVANPPVALTKLRAKDRVPCRICIRSLRTREFEITEVVSLLTVNEI